MSLTWNKECPFYKSNYFRELQTSATRPHVPGVTSGLPLSDRDVQISPALGIGRETRGQTLPSLSRERCSCTGRFLRKCPCGAPRGSGQAEARTGRAPAEAAPRSRCQEAGEAPGFPRPLGWRWRRATAQWKFPFSLHHGLVAVPRGGAGAGTIRQPQAGKARAGIIPAPVRAARTLPRAGHGGTR